MIGRADVAQIDARAVRADCSSPRVQLVADEQFVGDGLHFLGVQQHRVAPPFLEFEKARGLGVDLANRRCRASSKRCWRGCRRFEIGDEIGAVEDAVAEIADQRGQPGAAEQAAEIAHRVLAAYAGPVRKRRPGQHDRAGQVRAHRSHHHDLPAGLAIADQHRPAFRLRVAGDHRFDESASAAQTSSIPSDPAPARAGSRRSSRDGLPSGPRRSRCHASCRRCPDHGRRADRRR